MSGEIKNKNDRPIASLLSENIEFQQIVKPKNFSSKEITLDIEELIKKRIKDEVYEDVIRKENFSLEKQLNCKIYHGTIQLDHEKSQKSLENILNENGHSKNDKTNNAEEISGRLNKLLKELDLLCHLRLTLTHFNDLESKKKVINVSDLAASTEHILPIISSNNTKSQHLAPEEISKPSNSIDNTKTLEGTMNNKKALKRSIKLKIKAKKNARIQDIKSKHPELPISIVKASIKKKKDRYFSKKLDKVTDTKSNFKQAKSFFRNIENV